MDPYIIAGVGASAFAAGWIVYGIAKKQAAKKSTPDVQWTREEAQRINNQWASDATARIRLAEPITDPTLDIPEKPDRATELRLLDHRIQLVREMMLKAKSQKKRWKHHQAKWKQLTDRRATSSGTL